jgi:alpha-tubulin suppressor-like RCC1 family protein
MRLGAQGLPAADPVTAIAAGDEVSMALTKGGSVYVWGTADLRPTKINLDAAHGDRVVALTVGFGSGTVLTQGGDAYGIAGTGLAGPIQGFPASDPVVAISSGFDFMALTRTGRVYTWGYQVPVTQVALGVHGLPLNDSATAIADGNGYYLVLARSGRVYAWGANVYVTLGDTTRISRAYPVLVAFGQLQSPGFDPVVDVAAAGEYSVAIRRSGYLDLWGDNSHGQLGVGTTRASSIPVRAKYNDLWAINEVSTGKDHLLATVSIDESPEMYAWGGNRFGQLGTGGGKDHTVPTQIFLEDCSGGSCQGDSVTNTAAGDEHSLALVAGSLYAWGSNAAGQLGIASIARSVVPVAVNDYGTSWPSIDLVALAAGAAHSLALTDDGKVYAWGSNVSGQLGNGQTKNTSAPVQVRGLPAGDRVISIAAAGNLSLALTRSGKLYTWGSNARGQLGNGGTALFSSVAVAVQTGTNGLPEGDPVVVFAAGRDHALAVTQHGRLYSWGSNQFGQLGTGGSSDSRAPVAVLTGPQGLPAGDPVVAVAAGERHSLALTMSGALYAWGANTFGQLGTGTNVGSTTPVKVRIDAVSPPAAAR